MDDKAETMSTKKRLCETLNDLSSEELKKFKSLINLEKDFPLLARKQLEMSNTWDIVELMVDTYSRQCLGLTIYVLKLMDRTDLVQRLMDTSPGTKEKYQPSLRQRVETMESVIELLFEALKDLSKAELKDFKSTLCLVYIVEDSSVQYIPFDLLDKASKQGTVCLMVQYYGQQSVEMTKESLKMMERTDLVQRLSDSSSRSKKKHQSSLIKKAATMRAVKELLLETLNDLSYGEQKNFRWFLQFTFFQRSLPQIPWSRLLEEDMAEDMAESLVDAMVEKYGQKSVEVTREVLMDMNQTDLVPRLSETSTGLKEKHSVEEDWPALIQKVESMESVIQLLLETLKDLSVTELEEFNDALLSQPEFHRHSLSIPLMLLQTAHMQDTVFLMVQICGQKCVKKTKYILKMMERTDLVQRLSDRSSGSKKKHSTDEHRSALIHKVATIAAVQQLLLETLNYWNYKELWKFKSILRSTVSRKNLPDISTMCSYGEDRAQIVNEMVHTYGQQSVELTREVLMVMKRNNLVQRLSKPSSEEHLPASFERKLSLQLLQEKLLEMLKDFSPGDLGKFKHVLLCTKMKEDLPGIPRHLIETADRVQTVKLMVLTYGQQSEEVIIEVFNEMNRRDLVQRLSDISSGSEASESLMGPCYDATVRDKHSVDEHLSELMQKGATITTDSERLLNVLEHLKQEEFEKFKRFLQDSVILTGLPLIPHHRLEKGDMLDVVDLMLQTYSQQSVELTKKVLMDMKRTDLVQRLSQPSSGLKDPSRSLEHEDFGGAMQDSSDWTKLEPEVDSTDADEAPTYSLQSAAGNFECSVSGLRWVCKEKVSFKYQFCSWGEPAKRMEMISYMPAGPLMNIKVTAGKLDEAFLPHWICIENNPEIRDKFAVLHIDDCGDVVEKVAEVTSSHVKLSEPHFSDVMALVESGSTVDIHCYMLIYKTNKDFLTLDVYLIPCHPGLQKKLDDTYSEEGCQKIKKPHPEMPLRMNDFFILTAGVDGEEIDPEKLMLRYDENPSFFEVYIENAHTNFKLMLRRENKHEPVRTCKIRKGDYLSAARVQDAAPANQPSVLPLPTQLLAAEREVEHFVDKHKCDLIDGVYNIGPILDNLLSEGVIQQEFYDTIRTVPTTQEKMRNLYSGPLKAGGHAAKDVFFRILEEKESYLVAGLKSRKT